MIRTSVDKVSGAFRSRVRGTAGAARARALRPASLVAAALLAVAWTAAPAPATAQTVPPDGTWHTLETAHFRVTHRPHLEVLARRAAERGEAAWELLAGALVEPPEGRVDMVLADHTDFPNGLATVFPSNRIVVFAVPPVEGYDLSYFDDWLEIVVVHELAHVFHLDLAGPLGRAVRTVFGRIPMPWPAFPGLGLPTWAIEGLGTWYESAAGGTGRVHGSFHEMVVRTAVLEGRFEELDQVSGVSPVWPAGDRPYVYGSLFFDRLLELHGRDRLGRFAEAVAGQWVPYRLDAAARDAFGVPFSEAWQAWEVELEARYRALRDSLAARAPLTRGLPVTRGARRALHAAPSPDGERVAWARSDGRSSPQIRLALPDGSGDRQWVETSTLPTFSWHPDGGVVLAQLDFTDPYRIRGDLYRVDPEGGTRRLTRGARLDHPHVAPGGRRAVAIQVGGGSTRLVEVELESGAVRGLAGGGPDEHWSYPRISPDGRWIAASRWTPGGLYDVVIADRSGRVVGEVTRDRAVDITPAWSADGRWLLWSSDRTGIPNLFAVEVDPGTGAPGRIRQVTNVLTGAAHPSLDPRDRWIFYSAYHADGWDVERIPFDPAAWLDPGPVAPRFRGAEGRAGGGGRGEVEGAGREPDADAGAELAGTAGGPVQPYGPGRSLVPRHWVPILDVADGAAREEILGLGLGARTSGVDLVGRHRYQLAALYHLADGRWSGAASYTFAGLGNPELRVAARQRWDVGGPFLLDDPGGAPVPVFLAEREREVEAAATLVRRRVRSAAALRVAAGLIREERSLLEADGTESGFPLPAPEARLAETRATLSFSTARSYAFSLGLQEGWAGFLGGRVRRQVGLADSLREVVGSDRSFQEVTGRLRAYVPVPGPGYAPHVLALRVSGGAAAGAGASRFHFDLGGAAGTSEGLTGMGLFGGRRLLFPLRGYARDVRQGRYAWSASAEYRFPLALVHQGLGLFPLHLDRVSGALFVDGGDAWGPELGVSGFQNPRGDPLWSAGAELLGRVLPFWTSPVTVRLGVAWPMRDVPGGEGDGLSVHLRLGRSF